MYAYFLYMNNPNLTVPLPPPNSFPSLSASEAVSYQAKLRPGKRKPVLQPGRQQYPKDYKRSDWAAISWLVEAVGVGSGCHAGPVPRVLHIPVRVLRVSLEGLRGIRWRLGLNVLTIWFVFPSERRG